MLLVLMLCVRFGVSQFVRFKGCECGLTGDTGRIQPPNRRIVGGSVTDVSEYPWMVGLMTFSRQKNPFCGGTLITDRHVVTAAHCLQSAYARYATLGDHDTSVNNEVKSFLMRIRPYWRSQVVHPKYFNRKSSTDSSYDIAVLEIFSPLKFKFAELMNIRPLCLPDIENVRTVYTPLTVAGWGRIGYEDEQSDTLKAGVLWIESHYSCKKKFEQYFEIDPHVHICAYAPGTDACQGDSGGPLFGPVSQARGSNGTQHLERMELVGVTSFGKKCGLPGYPGVYVNVASVVEWVVKVAARRSNRFNPVVVCQGTFGPKLVQKLFLKYKIPEQ